MWIRDSETRLGLRRTTYLLENFENLESEIRLCLCASESRELRTS
jgi:hypothetical protein